MAMNPGAPLTAPRSFGSSPPISVSRLLPFLPNKRLLTSFRTLTHTSTSYLLLASSVMYVVFSEPLTFYLTSGNTAYQLVASLWDLGRGAWTYRRYRSGDECFTERLQFPDGGLYRERAQVFATNSLVVRHSLIAQSSLLIDRPGSLRGSSRFVRIFEMSVSSRSIPTQLRIWMTLFLSSRTTMGLMISVSILPTYHTSSNPTPPWTVMLANAPQVFTLSNVLSPCCHLRSARSCAA